MRWALRRHATKLALITPDRSLTYAQLQQRVMRLAGALQAAGIQPGDRVLCQLPDSAALIELRLAALEIGAVLMTMHAHADSEQVWKAITRVGPGLVVAGEHMPLARLALPEGIIRIATGGPYERWVEEAEPLTERTRFEPEATAALGMTSGTTGTPKLLAATHRSLMTSLQLLIRHLDLEAATHDIGVAMSAIPLSGAGGGMLLPSLLSGASLVIPRSYETQDLVNAIETHGVERLFLTPSQISDVLDLSADDLERLQSLRQIIYGTEIMHLPHLIEAIQLFGPILQQGYGSAEVLPPVTLLSPTAHRLAMVKGDWHALHSVGAAVPEVSVSVRGANGRSLPSGQVGKVWVTSPTRFSDHWQTGPGQGQGHEPSAGGTMSEPLYMGDLGYKDAMGRLHIMGREADVIVVDDGARLYPRELEDHMLSHRAIKEVVVTQGADRRGPVLVVAASLRRKHKVKLADEALAASLRDHLQTLKGLPPWPVDVRLVEKLPRSPLGKLLRKDVRQIALTAPNEAAESGGLRLAS
ncbi:long-chain fatty acid--CoA ligase [Hydrogenophaga sp. 5NK40-0174]